MGSIYSDVVEYEKEAPQIVAISNASAGWLAVLADEDRPLGYAVHPILCWAVIRRAYRCDGGKKEFEDDVAPVIAEVRANYPHGTVIASTFANFVGVAAPGEPPTEVLMRHRLVAMFEWAFGAPVRGEA